MRIDALAGAVSCAVLIAAAGCNGGALNSPVSQADGGEPSMDSGTPDSGTPDTGTSVPTVPAWATALCAPALGERLWVQSPDDMRTTLAGQWVLSN